MKNADTSTPFQIPLKTYGNTHKTKEESPAKPTVVKVLPRRPLTTKNAIEYLLAGTLKSKVCRFCLNVSQHLSELDQVMTIADRRGLYKVTIRNMVPSCYPVKVLQDPNFPNKICDKCLNKTIRSYLFAQECEQSERALRNCFEDIFEKLDKLDPLDKPKKRGRQKLHLNHNVLHTEHEQVLDYAEPVRHLINSSSVSYTKESTMGDLECKKCWQVLPNVESLVNHEKTHPKTMWYNCRTCGHAFAKLTQFRKHLRSHSKNKKLKNLPVQDLFKCNQCGEENIDYLCHLQHIEKHKFQTVWEHLLESKMDRLCAVCLERGKLTGLDKVISLHGGYPELTGERNLYHMLGSFISEMNMPANYTGHKICEKCLDKTVVSYVFINRTHYIRNRFQTCISQMLENLKTVEPESKLFIEIANNGIMPVLEYDYVDDFLLDESEVDESKLKVDVLEDEFRLESESEDSEPENESDVQFDGNNVTINKTTSKGKIKPKLMNGYQSNSSKVKDVCSEFLTFKKKRRKSYNCTFTCPLCSKKFISDYYLAKHVVKHTNKQVKCKTCMSKFKSRFCLQEHVKITHLMKKLVYSSCGICGRVFTDDQKLIKHQKCHVRKECQLCSKTFVNQISFDTHMQRHAAQFKSTKQKCLNCAFCSKDIGNDNEMSMHVNKIHLQLKPYSCDMCERQFYTEQDMRCHKKIHSLRCEQKCEFCNKSMKCRRDLVVHVRKHIGIKPFKCSICSQSFYSETKMKSHMKTWHGGCYCCRLCKKVFVNKTGLKNHANRAHSVF